MSVRRWCRSDHCPSYDTCADRVCYENAGAKVIYCHWGEFPRDLNHMVLAFDAEGRPIAVPRSESGDPRPFPLFWWEFKPSQPEQPKLWDFDAVPEHPVPNPRGWL